MSASAARRGVHSLCIRTSFPVAGPGAFARCRAALHWWTYRSKRLQRGRHNAATSRRSRMPPIHRRGARLRWARPCLHSTRRDQVVPAVTHRAELPGLNFGSNHPRRQTDLLSERRHRVHDRAPVGLRLHTRSKSFSEHVERGFVKRRDQCESQLRVGAHAAPPFTSARGWLYSHVHGPAA